MSPHELTALHVVHVAAVLVLIAYTFYGFAAPAETKRAVLSASGIAAIVVAATGLRLWQGLYGFAPLGWVFVKIACWLGIAALGAMGYKRRGQGRALLAAVLILAFIAVGMVYTKPF